MSNYGDTPQPPSDPYGTQPLGANPPANPGYSGYGGEPPYTHGVPTSSPKGFFGALFDLSFRHFITPMVVKVVYVLGMIGLVLVWLGFMLSAFSQSTGAGIFVLLFGPLFVILYLCLLRMTLEFYVAIVRMSEDINARLPRN